MISRSLNTSSARTIETRIGSVLFQRDPLYRFFIKFYESVNFGVYAGATLGYMLLVPVRIRMYETSPGALVTVIDLLTTNCHLLPFGIAPIVGTVLGYGFFRGIVKTIDALAARKLITSADAARALREIGRNSGGARSLCLTFALVCSAAVYLLTIESKRSGLSLSLSSIYLFGVSVLWWYLVAKGGVLTIAMIGQVAGLIAKARLDPYESDGFFGLRQLGDFIWTFLLFYVGLFGTYLGISAVTLGQPKLEWSWVAQEPFWAVLAILYLSVPSAWLWLVLLPAHRAMRRRKEVVLSNLERPTPQTADTDVLTRLAWVRSLPTWPLTRVELYSALTGIPGLPSTIGAIAGWSVFAPLREYLGNTFSFWAASCGINLQL
jgi:hypothetical protein